MKTENRKRKKKKREQRNGQIKWRKKQGKAIEQMVFTGCSHLKVSTSVFYF